MLADNVVGEPGVTVMSPISIPGTRRTAGDFALPPRNVPPAVITPWVSHMPVAGMSVPYSGMSSQTASARNWASGRT